MKKTCAITLSAALILSGAPLAALAKDTALPGILTDTADTKDTDDSVTAEEFIETYCGYTLTSISKDKKVKETFVWYSQATEKNYEILIKGSQLFSRQTEEIQKQILKAAKQADRDLESLWKQASEIEKDQKLQKEKEEASLQNNSNKTEAQQTETSDASQSQPASESQSGQPAAGSFKQSQPEGQNSPQEAGSSQPVLENESSLTSDKEEKEDETVQDIAKTQDSLLQPDSSSAVDEENTDTSKEDSKNTDSSEKEETKAETETAEVLYSGVLKAEKTSLSYDTQLTITGQPASEDSVSKSALEAYLDQQGIEGAEIFEDVLYTASAKDKQAVSQTLWAAIGQDGSLYLFQILWNEDNTQADVRVLSRDMISYDFVNQSLNLSVTDQFAYTPALETETEGTASEDTSAGNKVFVSFGQASVSGGQSFLSASGGETSSQTALMPADFLQAAALTEDSVSDAGNDEIQPESQALSLETAVDSARIFEEVSAGVSQTQVSLTPAVQSASSQLNAAVSKEDSTDTAAAQFVKTYCSSSSGQVYSAATTSNYQQIMNGFSVWKSMTTAQKNQVNTLLTNQGGSKFQTLYIQANQIRLSAGTSTGSSTQLPSLTTNPSTASSSYSLWYSLTCVVSLAFSFLFFRKSRKPNFR